MSVLVVVPTYEERENVQRVVRELLDGAGPEPMRVLVVDGGSSDGTVEAARALGRPEVEVLHNPAKLQAAAVNLAVEHAHPDEDVFVRADAHCAYPPGFVSHVAGLLREKADEGAVSVVVPMRTVGEEPLQVAIAATQNSVLGNGGAAHRAGADSGWIDHGHHAAMRVDAFREVGGYDEGMVANEDAELDERLREAGGKIWFAGDAVIDYFPRSTLTSLAKQYRRYGAGRAITVLRHHTMPKLRQLAPAAVTAVNAAALLASLKDRRFLLVPGAYAAAVAVLAARAAREEEDPTLLMIAPAAMVQHHAWGAGFLHRLGKAGVETIIASDEGEPAGSDRAAAVEAPADASPAGAPSTDPVVHRTVA